MYQNFVPARFKNSISVLVLAGINSIPARTEVIVTNRTDLFRNISMLGLHGKIDVGCYLLKRLNLLNCTYTSLSNKKPVKSTLLLQFEKLIKKLSHKLRH